MSGRLFHGAQDAAALVLGPKFATARGVTGLPRAILFAIYQLAVAAALRKGDGGNFDEGFGYFAGALDISIDEVEIAFRGLRQVDLAEPFHVFLLAAGGP